MYPSRAVSLPLLRQRGKHFCTCEFSAVGMEPRAVASERKQQDEAGDPPADRRSEEERAAAYLDLWERHLTRLAVRGSVWKGLKGA